MVTDIQWKLIDTDIIQGSSSKFSISQTFPKYCLFIDTRYNTTRSVTIVNANQRSCLIDKFSLYNEIIESFFSGGDVTIC